MLVSDTTLTAELGDGRLIDDDQKSAAGRRTVGFPQEIVPELKWHMECFAKAGENLRQPP